ncbi:Ribonuclease P protein component [bioreactor metagenome]|uniref:Ribonuclease P protein component n=1 Tax=bioreactor metagenome TaxID=1076179 RepID=A0A644XIM6_9ZZZZ
MAAPSSTLAAPRAASVWLSKDLPTAGLGVFPGGVTPSPGCKPFQIAQGVAVAHMHRLKTRPQFQAALAGGTVSRTPHFALHRLGLVPPEHGDATEPAPETNTPTAGSGSVPQEQHAAQALFVVAPPQAAGPWLGAMVPKRWARRAVTRNTIKRQIYVAGAAFEAQLPVAAHVVRLRSAFDRKQFPSATSDALKAAVREELAQLFAYAVCQKNAKPSKAPKPRTERAERRDHDQEGCAS